MVLNEETKDIIAASVLGETVSALLSNKKNVGEDIALGDIAGVAFMATYRAYERAKNSDEPMIVEEEGALYEVHNNTKRFIKNIEKSDTVVPKKFKL